MKCSAKRNALLTFVMKSEKESLFIFVMESEKKCFVYIRHEVFIVVMERHSGQNAARNWSLELK